MKEESIERGDGVKAWCGRAWRPSSGRACSGLLQQVLEEEVGADVGPAAVRAA